MALTDSLVAYWRLDESSGTRADASGNGRDLTDASSVGAAVGKIGDAVDLVRASSDVLTTTDATVRATLKGDASFTLSFWLYPDLNTTLSLAEGAIETRVSYGFQVVRGSTGWEGDNYLRARFVNTAYTTFSAMPTHATTLGSWYHVAIWLNVAGDNKVYCRINDTTQAASSAALSGTLPTQATLRIGGGSGSSYFDGRVDEVGLWSRALSAAEITSLYNAGAGLAYPFSSGQPAALRGVFVPGMTTGGRRIIGAGWGG